MTIFLRFAIHLAGEQCLCSNYFHISVIRVIRGLNCFF